MTPLVRSFNGILTYPPHTVYRDGSVYCPISQRTEGTRHMRGEVCSWCAEHTGKPFARTVKH